MTPCFHSFFHCMNSMDWIHLRGHSICTAVECNQFQSMYSIHSIDPNMHFLRTLSYIYITWFAQQYSVYDCLVIVNELNRGWWQIVRISYTFYIISVCLASKSEPLGSPRYESWLTKRCRSKYIDTFMFRIWWLLISFNRAKTVRPTQAAKEPHAPNCALPISI